MRKFVKYDHFWWEYDETTSKNNATLINVVGGHNSCNDITKCEIVEAKDFEYLDWNGTKVLDERYQSGWLDRKGNFYGCEFEYHRLQAELVHHSSLRELERQGWIHIDKDMFYNTGKVIAEFWADIYDPQIIPTDEQIFFLLQHGGIDAQGVLEKYQSADCRQIKSDDGRSQ